MSDSSRTARAERFRPYFDLQLRFAAAMATACGYGLARSLVLNTNFHRRFALGTWKAEAVDPFWLRYVAAMERAPGHEARLDLTCHFFERAEVERMPADQKQFGCFALEPATAEGVVRIHFGNRLPIRDGLGPLSLARRQERMAELLSLFAFVQADMPKARVLSGGSWLYNVEAYCRLFPPSFVASKTRPAGLRNFSGSSSWGQFLDHKGNVKQGLKARFLEKLKELDPENPADAFPMPALRTRASISDFYDFYDVCC